MTPAVAGLSALALASAAVCVVAQLRGALRTVYVSKPLATAAILAVAWLAPEPADPVYRRLVVLGLLCSLAGDVFLMLPADRFLPGLASFLVAHLLYIAAFSGAATLRLVPVAALPFAALSLLVLRALWPHLDALRAPVCGYVAVIASMGTAALAQWWAVDSGWAALALLGAVAFLASDTALAFDRFRGPLPAAPLLVLGTYFPAQWWIALSVQR